MFPHVVPLSRSYVKLHTWNFMVSVDRPAITTTTTTTTTIIVMIQFSFISVPA